MLSGGRSNLRLPADLMSRRQSLSERSIPITKALPLYKHSDLLVRNDRQQLPLLIVAERKVPCSDIDKAYLPPDRIFHTPLLKQRLEPFITRCSIFQDRIYQQATGSCRELSCKHEMSKPCVKHVVLVVKPSDQIQHGHRKPYQQHKQLTSVRHSRILPVNLIIFSSKDHKPRILLMESLDSFATADC